MSTFEIITRSNEYLETKSFLIKEDEVIDNKTYVSYPYEFQDENRAKSKLALLIALRS